MARRQIYITRLTDVENVDKEGVGTLRNENSKWYKYILYNAGTGVVAGTANNIVVYHGDDGVDDNEVTMDYTDGVVVAGVLQAAMTNGQYGWIQTKGPATLGTTIEASNDTAPVAVADGFPIVRGDADGAARRQNTVIDADAERLPEIGIMIDASVQKVLLDCPW